jgi:hypothetical protein
MRYFIFDFNRDLKFIPSFLKSAAEAHHQPKKTKEWFLWKFRDNPFGATILSCAEEDGEIVGCVAYGLQDFFFKNKVIKGAISFETFLHPKFQKRGIFSKLIAIGEKETQKQGIKFLLNFPNLNSLKGFLNMGWNKIDISQYWIKGRNLITIPANVQSLRKNYKPNSPNWKDLISPNNFRQTNKEFFEMCVTLKYLRWRFFNFPNGNYYWDSNDNYDLIGRYGQRGSLKEFQILYLNKKTSEFRYSKMLKNIKKELIFDLLGVCSTPNNLEKIKLIKNGFIKVPNRTNVCYKIIDESLIKKSDMNKLTLQGINYHTY